MAKDWSNCKTIYTIGATNHSEEVRASEDYYATEPKAVEVLLEAEKFCPVIWEPACGEGHISEVLKKHGHIVTSTDLVDRGYGDISDFLNSDFKVEKCDIITNPPYKYALEFCQRAIDVLDDGHKVAMFLRLQFLESKRRKPFFLDNPPKIVYVSSSRLHCARNGSFSDTTGSKSNAVAYAWFVWEKNYKGNTNLKWIN